jgi:two-component system response regulator FixJ
MSDNATIFLVDDNDAVRHAVRLFLECRNFNVREFASAESLLESIRDGDSGVLVVDVRMNGMSGLELQNKLNTRHIDLPIIFITGHGNIQDSVSALKAGARDFIEKPFENDVLLESINQALQEEASRKEMRAVKTSLTRRFESLTPREREVMQYIAEGISNKHLAELLGVSSRTIEVHRSRIMAKMGANSLPELVRMALSINLIEPHQP